MAVRVCSLTARRTSSTLATQGLQAQFDDTPYKNAKPFQEIPGPKGLPFLGTLFQYTRGKRVSDSCDLVNKLHNVMLTVFLIRAEL